MRGALLASALERRGHSAAVWVASERAGLARTLCSRVVACPRPDSPGELRQRLERLLGELGATRLVVDTFVEGITGELAGALPCARSVALLRARRDAARPAFAKALERYTRALDVEPGLEWLPAGLDTVEAGPVARRLERAPGAGDVLLAAGGGELRRLFGRLGQRLRAAGLDVREASSTGSLLDARALSATVVVAAAGYNLTYELAHLGSWHAAVPLGRRFDDQHARAQRFARVCRSPEALERLVTTLVRARAERPRSIAVWSHDQLATEVLAA